MTPDLIPFDAEPLLSWPGLLAAFEAGPRLPRPDIKDLFCYRCAETLPDRATWRYDLGSLVHVSPVVSGNAPRVTPIVHPAPTPLPVG